MKASIGARPPGNLALLELDQLNRFGVYTRLHFEDRSYRNIDEFQLAGSLAHLLRDFRVARGDRVLAMMPNSPELMALFPAVWSTGGAIVPVIPQWTATEVANVLAN